MLNLEADSSIDIQLRVTPVNVTTVISVFMVNQTGEPLKMTCKILSTERTRRMITLPQNVPDRYLMEPLDNRVVWGHRLLS